MAQRATDSNEYRELVQIVHEVRRRWRMKLAMRGLAALVLTLLAALLISAFAVGELNFAPVAILGARIVLAILFLGLFGALVLTPLWKRVTDQQVALYLEERAPSLRLSVVSALATGTADAEISPALARRTVRNCSRTLPRNRGRSERLEVRSLTRSGGVLAVAIVVGLIVLRDVAQYHADGRAGTILTRPSGSGG